MSTQYKFPSFLIDSHLKLEFDVDDQVSDRFLKPLRSEKHLNLLPPKRHESKRIRLSSESSVLVHEISKQYADQFLYVKKFETTEENKRYMRDKSI